MKEIKNGTHYVRFFLYAAFILFLISLLFPWVITTHFLSNKILSYDYGYSEIEAIYITLFSIIPIIIYHFKPKFIGLNLIIPIIQFSTWWSYITLSTIPEERHSFGYGYFLAIMGIIYQLIGIILARKVVKDITNRNNNIEDQMRPRSPASSR